MKNILAKLKNCISCFDKQLFLASNLAINSGTKLVALLTVTIFLEALNSVANLEDRILIIIAAVFLNEGKEGGNHGFANVLMVGSLGVDDFNGRNSLNAKLLIFLGVCPNIGMNLVHTVALNENVLHSVFLGLKNLFSYGKKRALCGKDVKVIVAVNSCDLLNNVRLNGNVLCRTP